AQALMAQTSAAASADRSALKLGEFMGSSSGLKWARWPAHGQQASAIVGDGPSDGTPHEHHLTPA
ncbi:MAG: hypothetical protein CFE45_40945, partial [Burkholderiales bacterium PBB5]